MTAPDPALSVHCRLCGARAGDVCEQIIAGGWICARPIPHLERLADAIAEARR